MIRQNVKDWAEKLGIDTAYAFWKLTELNEQTAYRLWKDAEYIPRHKVMWRLYEVFGWQPGQYLYAQPEGKQQPEDKQQQQLEPEQQQKSPAKQQQGKKVKAKSI